VFWFCGACCGAVRGSRAAAADAPHTKLAEIHVGGVGAFDYLTVDPAAKRLYLPWHDVVVIDLTTNTVSEEYGHVRCPRHRGDPAPGGHLTSNGRENKVSIVDAKSRYAQQGGHGREP
jgi:hypothetical protein